jgi:hypothetical protein
MDPSTQPIIEAAAEFLWSDELQESLDTFARNHASMFAGCTNTASEQKLECVVHMAARFDDVKPRSPAPFTAQRPR